MVDYIQSRNGYYYKVLKNGKKSRISKSLYEAKIQTGGSWEPFINNIVPEMARWAYVNLINSPQYRDTEACGFVQDNWLYLDGEGKTEYATNGRVRKMCEYGPNTKDKLVVWHTHPTSSRSYPSYEDVEKVILFTRESKKTEIGLLFTSVGHWVIQRTGPFITYDHNLRRDDLLGIYKVYQELYVQNGYNENAYKEFAEKLSNNFPNVKIVFVPFER